MVLKLYIKKIWIELWRVLKWAKELAEKDEAVF